VEFEASQLIVFVAILGGGMVLMFGFAVRAIYLAIRASGQVRLDWFLAVGTAVAGGVFFAFQLWRILLRF
jgi:hypothetical protein